MAKKKREEKKYIKREVIYVLYGIAIVMAITLAQFFSFREVDDSVIASVDYKQESNISYRVFYKQNEYYTDPYVPENQQYIASLVDQIEIDYTHYNYYSRLVDGDYEYDITAKLIVYDKDNNLIWDKYYSFKADRKAFNQEGEYLIKESILLDFKELSDTYYKYKEENELSSSAVVYVDFNIDGVAEYSDLDKINTQGRLGVEIPLSESTFKINKVLDHPIGMRSVSKTKTNYSEKVYSLIISALLWLLAVVLFAFLIFSYRLDVKKQGEYIRKLKKILSSYDSIIVNVEKIPSLTGLTVINVTSFEELLDAQSEVRLPINFKEEQNKKIAKFVLISSNLAWVYVLKEDKKVKDN